MKQDNGDAHNQDATPNNTMSMDMDFTMDDTDMASNGARDYSHAQNHQVPGHQLVGAKPHDPSVSSNHSLQNQPMNDEQPQELYPGPSFDSHSTVRTESGDSQRSQTRRGAAVHAEMQRSAFISAQDEINNDDGSNSKHKIKAAGAPARNDNMDDSDAIATEETCDTQRQKRARLFTREQQH